MSEDVKVLKLGDREFAAEVSEGGQVLVLGRLLADIAPGDRTYGQPVVVAQRLRSLEIPFVLSSAYDIFTFEGSEALAGAENVQKPISEGRLIAALRRALS